MTNKDGDSRLRNIEARLAMLEEYIVLVVAQNNMAKKDSTPTWLRRRAEVLDALESRLKRMKSNVSHNLLNQEFDVGNRIDCAMSKIDGYLDEELFVVEKAD